MVLADTTALMTAIYSEPIVDDRGLYEMALRDHAQSDLTLLTSLDLAWTADGLSATARVCASRWTSSSARPYQRHQLPYNVVAGRGVARVQHALSAIEP